MIVKKSQEILKKLHNNYGIPRLEIQGIGEPSELTKRFEIFNNNSYDKAVYILRDLHYREEKYSEKICFKYSDFITFTKFSLEHLIEKTLNSNPQKSTLRTSGFHFSNNKSKKQSDSDTTKDLKSSSLKLQLDLTNNKPIFLLNFNDY